MAAPSRSFSQINIKSWVTVTPSRLGFDQTTGFVTWREQMRCVLESHDLTHFVYSDSVDPVNSTMEARREWRILNSFIRGWILATIGTDLLNELRDKATARELWVELEKIFQGAGGGIPNQTGVDYSIHLPLYRAVMREDQSTVMDSIEHMDLSTPINSHLETLLHIVVSKGKSAALVDELVGKMSAAALAIQDINGDTALHHAAFVGNTAAATAMVRKSPDLLHVFNNSNQLPVFKAIAFHKETLRHLISQHETHFAEDPELFGGQQGVFFLNEVIRSGYVDIAWRLAHDYPQLAQSVDVNGSSALSVLAQTEALFPRKDELSLLQNLIYCCAPVKTNSEAETGPTTQAAPDIENLNNNCAAIVHVQKKLVYGIWHIIECTVRGAKELRETKSTKAQALKLAHYLCDKTGTLPQNEASGIFMKSMHNAAIHGIAEVVEMIVEQYPMAIHFRDPVTGMNVFQLAVSYRFRDVIRLFHKKVDCKYVFGSSKDKQNNNLLHICAKLPPSHRLNHKVNPALQMQQEWRWFKEVENFVPVAQRTRPNLENLTPQMLFAKEHGELKESGEKWLRKTATAGNIGAVLIAGMVFAAILAVPGGIDSKSGKPLLKKVPFFLVFVVSVTVSLIFSITSVLLFHSINTSRFAQEDFLSRLPRIVGWGIFTLFMSIFFMLVAYCATLYLLLQGEFVLFMSVVGIVAILWTQPAISMVIQLPALADIISSTYCPDIFIKKTKLRL